MLPASTTTTTRAWSSVEQVAAETLAAVLDGDVTSDDIADIAALDLSVLPAEAVTAVVAALNNAPEDVKRELEEATNVFSGALDSYVPSGSNVSVGERRTIVAITATVASPLSPVSAVRRRR